MIAVTSTAWAAIASAAAAAGTLALAIFTAVTAHRTRQMADETRKLADVGAKEVEAAERLAEATVAATRAASRPWLGLGRLGSPRGGEVPGWANATMVQGVFRIRFAVRNIGNGLALIDTERSFVSWGPTYRGRFSGWVNEPAIAPQSESRVGTTVAISPGDTPESLAAQRVQFRVDLCYTDADGQQTVVARFLIDARTGGQWLVTRVEYYEPDEYHKPVGAKPFQVLNPRTE